MNGLVEKQGGVAPEKGNVPGSCIFVSVHFFVIPIVRRSTRRDRL